MSTMHVRQSLPGTYGLVCKILEKHLISDTHVYLVFFLSRFLKYFYFIFYIFLLF